MSRLKQFWFIYPYEGVQIRSKTNERRFKLINRYPCPKKTLAIQQYLEL